MYIGQTSKTFSRRKKQHLSAAKRNCGLYFHRALYQYGENNFKWKVLEDNVTIKDARILEQIYIDLFDTYNNGYNLTLGGEGALSVPKSEETKEKIRATIKKNGGNKGAKNPMYGSSGGFAGKKHSEETKRKMSKAQLGEKNHRWGAHWSEEEKEFRRKASSGENNPFYGKHHTDETKRKMSEARKKRCALERERG